jgi:hypothetical protein
MKGVGEGGGMGSSEASMFDPEPDLGGGIGDDLMAAGEVGLGFGGADRMKLEIDAGGVEGGEGGECGKRWWWEGAEAPMPFDAGPVVLAEGGEDGVAHGELGLGEVASDEVGVVRGEVGEGETGGGEEEAGAAVHEEAGGLGERDAGSVAMGIATGEEGVVAEEPVMTEDEVIGEHGRTALTEAVDAEDLEFDLDPGGRGEFFGELMEEVVVTAFGEEAIAWDDEIEFEVIVGEIPLGRGEDAAFTAAIATAEEESEPELFGDPLVDSVAYLEADLMEVLFEGRAAVGGEAVRGRGHVEGCGGWR